MARPTRRRAAYGCRAAHRSPRKPLAVDEAEARIRRCRPTIEHAEHVLEQLPLTDAMDAVQGATSSAGGRPARRPTSSPTVLSSEAVEVSRYSSALAASSPRRRRRPGAAPTVACLPDLAGPDQAALLVEARPIAWRIQNVAYVEELVPCSVELVDGVLEAEVALLDQVAEGPCPAAGRAIETTSRRLARMKRLGVGCAERRRSSSATRPR